MERFYASLKTLRPVQVMVLLSLLVASGGVTYAGYEWSSRGPSNGLEEDQQLIPIGYGDLVRQVTTSGSLEFPNRETMSFGVAGTVDRLLVREGQRVTAGQELARLDAATGASLAQSVAQAQVDVITAQKILDELVNPTALSMAQARQKIAKAEFDLKAANEVLEEANIPFSQEEIKTQEQSVASARLQVQDAEEALGLLGRTHSQSLALALLNIADAKAALVDARNALETYEEANVTRLEEAPVDQAEAQKSYDDTLLKLESILVSQASGVPGLDALVLQTQEILALRKDTLDSANAELVPLEQLVAKKDKAESDFAEATSVLADLGTGAVTPSLETQLAEIEVARAGLESVQASGLDATAAEAELSALRLGLSAIESGAGLVQVSLLEADIVQAWAKLGKEELDLADMIAGPDSVALVLHSREIDVAVASLEQANQDLKDLQSPSAADIALLKSKLTAAQATHDAALEKLESVSIRAPFEGFISVVSVAEGDQVGANAEIVEAVDPSVVEMDGIVDEVDILLLREGITASVTVDALPGRTLSGVVIEIAPAATIQQGVVTYPVRVQVQIPEDLELRDGLSAMADLVLEQQLNVLLLPEQAIFGSFQAPTVMLETESGIEERPVILGDSDGFWTEVQAGLDEGDRVVIQNAQVSDDPFQAFRDRIGGGVGGGGAFPGRR